MTRIQTFVALLLGSALTLLLALVYASRSPTVRPGPSDDMLRQVGPTEIQDTVRAGAARLTMVNFWATWCAPCRREFPLILGLARELAPRGLKLILVSVDEAADFEEAKGVLKEMGVDFPTFYKGSGSLNFVSDLFPRWSGAIPATLLFGPHAELVDAWEGDSSWNELKRKITARLVAR
jgi:thiol-disulfide isomerase/thioredoxin